MVEYFLRYTSLWNVFFSHKDLLISIHHPTVYIMAM